MWQSSVCAYFCCVFCVWIVLFVDTKYWTIWVTFKLFFFFDSIILIFKKTLINYGVLSVLIFCAFVYVWDFIFSPLQYNLFNFLGNFKFWMVLAINCLLCFSSKYFMIAYRYHLQPTLLEMLKMNKIKLQIFEKPETK